MEGRRKFGSARYFISFSTSTMDLTTKYFVSGVCFWLLFNGGTMLDLPKQPHGLAVQVTRRYPAELRNTTIHFPRGGGVKNTHPNTKPIVLALLSLSRIVTPGPPHGTPFWNVEWGPGNRRQTPRGHLGFKETCSVCTHVFVCIPVNMCVCLCEHQYCVELKE